MKKDKKGMLEMVLGILGGLSIIASLFFLSGNLTGNAIVGMDMGTTNLLGGGLFVLGIFLLFTVRKMIL